MFRYGVDNDKTFYGERGYMTVDCGDDRVACEEGRGQLPQI